MHVFDARVTVLLTVALVALGAAERSAAQAPEHGGLGAVRGTTIDVSAGVLPGVTVVAAAVDGRALGSTITNARGEFAFDGLPAGPVALSFHLDGFDDSRTSVIVRPGGPGRSGDERLVHRLELLARTPRASPFAATLRACHLHPGRYLRRYPTTIRSPCADPPKPKVPCRPSAPSDRVAMTRRRCSSLRETNY